VKSKAAGAGVHRVFVTFSSLLSLFHRLDYRGTFHTAIGNRHVRKTIISFRASPRKDTVDFGYLTPPKGGSYSGNIGNWGKKKGKTSVDAAYH